MTNTDLSKWIERVRTAEKSGDLVIAYELATQGLGSHPENVHLRYLATRVLARSGATIQAAAQYRRFGLDRQRALEIAALGARIAKDGALAMSKNRRGALRSAAAIYGRLYARTRAQYPAINAATLYLLSGDRKRAHRYAHLAVKASDRSSGHTALDRYYRLAIEAEAALIFNDPEGARRALQKAARHLRGNFDAAATTRKQLRLICRAAGIETDVLDIIRPPAVLRFYDSAPTINVLHRDGGRAFTNHVVAHLARHNIGFAYGSLTAGGEILCAEACLRAGVELHAILPFNKDEFVEVGVRPAGPRWVRRFEACLRRTRSVTFATPDSYQGDDELFGYANNLSMGIAKLRAGHLDTAVFHLDCDAPPEAGPALAPTLQQVSRATRQVGKLLRINRPPPRFCRALVFGDVKGFSRIADHLIPVFQKRLMGTLATVLKSYRGRVLYRNSWGDAIYVVIDEPVAAAECCLAMQEAILRANTARYGLPSELALRLAAHFGPVYDGRDPIRGEPTFFGACTTLAARMEPVTPPGHVYVTEAMAAAIATANAPRLHVEYVGNVPMAKGFGSTRMYSLNRAADSDPANRRAR